MIVNQELVKRIKEYFNLNIYETKVWLALLSKGIASAGEIAELSGVPRSRTYDVLESLEKRGFAIVKIGKPVKYISVKPIEVIEKMKSKTVQEANEKVASLVKLKGTPEYVELEQLHNSGISPIKSADITGSLRGRSNIISKIRELLETAKKEVLICTTAEDFEDKSRVIAPVLQKLAKSDIKLRIALSGDAEKLKKLSAKYNLKIKPIESKAKIFVADKKEVFFMVSNENSEDEMGVWLDSPFFSESLAGIVDQSIAK
jgi:sugar-specific transcriptional regulator TrmB